jgi:lipoate-protein ligase A
MSDERVKKHPSAACFASSTQADLTSGGFKLVGSAQVWKGDVLLQQGSLPLEDRADDFFDLLHYPDEETRQQALAIYRQQTTPLHTFAPSATWGKVAHAFQQSFSGFLRHEFVEDELSTSEWELARQLVNDKYRQIVWKRENAVNLT